MGNTQIYSFFLANSAKTFLFKVKLEIALRPNLGDSLTDPITLQNFKILRDEFNISGSLRVDDNNLLRVTDDGESRITDSVLTPDDVTHNYFVTPANNPNRISSYTTAGFANDQTLKQLFR